MKRMTCGLFLLVMAAIWFTGAAALAQDDSHPLVGTWAHSIDTPEGAYVGSITIQMTNDVLSGTIGFDSPSVTPAPLEDIAFDGADLAFTFGTDYGVAEVKVTLDGDSFSGAVDVPGAEAYGLSMKGDRKAAGER
jgi:hypothetical protein